MKYIRDGKVIETTERLYNMIYKQIGYLPLKEVEDTPKLELEALTVKELKEQAKELGIEGYSDLKKDELVQLINNFAKGE